MSSWNWSLQNVGWKETVGLTMAVIVLLEGPNFYSDVVRGIAVGMFVMLLWLMLAERRALIALLCVSFVGPAMNMSPYQPPEGQGSSGHVIARHIMVAMFVVILALGAWYRYRLARSGAQVPQG